MVSLWFIMVSIWILVWILKKDCGTEKMIEISETIKEGSQGYFVTQYTSIFKLALLFGAGIFLMYLFRAPTKNSTLWESISTPVMAIFISFSFLLGAFCSAISGYAGLWVSVRANVRVAAAARTCYDKSMKICFWGGAFSAIVNVALALGGISF